MGEHQPKPIYYIKVSQDIHDDIISVAELKEEFSKNIGVVADLYRPANDDGMPKEFAFVGKNFYQK